MKKDNYIKTNDPDYVIDPKSKAVINSNLKEYEMYKLKLEQNKQKKILEDKVESLTNEMTELKAILQTIIQEKKNGR